MFSYSNPLRVAYLMGQGGTAQANLRIPAKMEVNGGETSNARIEAVGGMVGSSPAAFTVKFGDGTTVDKYGTLAVAAGGTANGRLPGKLTLNKANYEIDAEVITATAAAAADAAANVTVVVAYW